MSGEFTKVARLPNLKTSKLMCVQPRGQRIALTYVDGKVFAVDDMCSHEDASLSKGSLHGECVTCPLHGSRFDLNTGAALGGEPGSSYDALVYSGALALWHLKQHDSLAAAADAVRAVLNNGKALEHFNNARA